MGGRDATSSSECTYALSSAQATRRCVEASVGGPGHARLPVLALPSLPTRALTGPPAPASGCGARPGTRPAGTGPCRLRAGRAGQAPMSRFPAQRDTARPWVPGPARHGSTLRGEGACPPSGTLPAHISPLALQHPAAQARARAHPTQTGRARDPRPARRSSRRARRQSTAPEPGRAAAGGCRGRGSAGWCPREGQGAAGAADA